MTAKSVNSVRWSHDWCYRCCRNYDILLLQNTIFHIRHRRIHAKRTNDEREAGTNYNLVGSQISQISELESWLMLQMLSKLWYTSVANANFTIIVTTGSIRREIAKKEKQGPTTTEMTAKSVKSVSWSHEWWYRCCWHYDALILSMSILPSSSPPDPYGEN